MKRQAVLSVLFIFLFFCFLLCMGLTISERALQQVSGSSNEAAAIRLLRDQTGVWELYFAGRFIRFDQGIWQVFHMYLNR